jgi:hypothetical protein
LNFSDKVFTYTSEATPPSRAPRDISSSSCPIGVLSTSTKTELCISLMACWRVASPYILASPQCEYWPSGSRALARYLKRSSLDNWSRAFSCKRCKAVFMNEQYITQYFESQIPELLP